VGAVECEPGVADMVESRRGHEGREVVTLVTGTRSGPIGELIGVRRAMTVLAAVVSLLEEQGRLRARRELFVAQVARNRGVSLFQRIVESGVLARVDRRRSPRQRPVTLVAIVRESAAVRVAVTRCTSRIKRKGHLRRSRVRDGQSRPIRSVTGRTFEFDVTTRQR